MKIGDLAAATGTPVETIRYYEREGLLPAPPRSAGNYRVYGEAHVQRLAFIRRCRSLDMAQDEIRALLGYRDDPAAHCGQANAVLDAHIGHVEQRIAELQTLARQLRELRGRCQALPGGECGILSELDQPGAAGLGEAPAAAHVEGVHGRMAGRHGPGHGH